MEVVVDGEWETLFVATKLRNNHQGRELAVTCIPVVYPLYLSSRTLTIITLHRRPESKDKPRVHERLGRRSISEAEQWLTSV